jgi:hypothetical protein
MQRIHFGLLLARRPAQTDVRFGGRRVHPLLILGILLLYACAGGPKAAPPPAAPARPARAAPPPPAEPPAPRASTEHILIANVTNDKNSPYIGVIDREGLQAIVDQGLGRLLARLKVSPVLQRGHFQGFRVTALDPAWNGGGVQIDDVIQHLNGLPIERPEQAQAAFESLREASEISVDLVREGKPRKLRYSVESRVNNE